MIKTLSSKKFVGLNIFDRFTKIKEKYSTYQRNDKDLAERFLLFLFFLCE